MLVCLYQGWLTSVSLLQLVSHFCWAGVKGEQIPKAFLEHRVHPEKGLDLHLRVDGHLHKAGEVAVCHLDDGSCSTPYDPRSLPSPIPKCFSR